MVNSPHARRQVMKSLISTLEDKRSIRAEAATDETGLLAGIFQTPTNDVWYIERRDLDATHGYRVLVVRPNFVTKPTVRPEDHLQGKLQKEELQSSQVFIFDVPTDDVKSLSSVGGLKNVLLDLFRYGLNNTLQHKQNANSDRQIWRAYERFFQFE